MAHPKPGKDYNAASAQNHQDRWPEVAADRNADTKSRPEKPEACDLLWARLKA